MKNLAVIIDWIFDVYLYILILRLFLQKLSASYLNPIVRFVYEATEILIKPFRRFVPGYHGFDLAIIVLMLILSALQSTLVFWPNLKIIPGFFGMLIIVLADLSNKVVNLFFIAVILSAIFSWFPALQRSVLTQIVNLLAEPLLRTCRRFIPMVGGFDFSPIIIILFLVLLSNLILVRLIDYGTRLALR